MAALNSIDRPFTQLKIDIAATTDVLAAPSIATQQYIIYAINLQAAGAVTVTFNHGTTAFEGARTMATGVPLNLGMHESLHPLYVGAAGEKFNITLSSGVQISGSIWYTLGPI